MNFASYSTIFLVCVFCSNYSFAFKLNADKPNENEINFADNYYIQNFQSGLVIGAVNSGDPRSQPITMVSIDEAASNPELQAKLLWNLTTQAGIPSLTTFHTLGPNVYNSLQVYEQCTVIGCGWPTKYWVLISRGNSTWGIRNGYLGPTDHCLTAHGLHEELTWAGPNDWCDTSNDSQKWRLVKVV